MGSPVGGPFPSGLRAIGHSRPERTANRASRPPGNAPSPVNRDRFTNHRYTPQEVSLRRCVGSRWAHGTRTTQHRGLSFRGPSAIRERGRSAGGPGLAFPAAELRRASARRRSGGKWQPGTARRTPPRGQATARPRRSCGWSVFRSGGGSPEMARRPATPCRFTFHEHGALAPLARCRRPGPGVRRRLAGGRLRGCLRGRRAAGREDVGEITSALHARAARTP